MSQEGMSPATAARLPVYIRGLRELAESGVQVTCSRSLSKATGLEAHQIRKDLSRLGTLGKRGVGYHVQSLLSELTTYVSLSRTWRVAIVGCGRLGTALAAHLYNTDGNFLVVAAFDCSMRKIGTKVAGVEVTPWTRIPATLAERAADMAIIATPPPSAQGAADLVVLGRVGLILNFAPVHLTVPDWVLVRNVDLANEMLVLSVQASSKRAVGPNGRQARAIPYTHN